MRPKQLVVVSVSVAAGATGAFVLDPEPGRQRGALVRDQLRHHLKAFLQWVIGIPLVDRVVVCSTP